jgi:hypothetical protein
MKITNHWGLSHKFSYSLTSPGTSLSPLLFTKIVALTMNLLARYQPPFLGVGRNKCSNSNGHARHPSSIREAEAAHPLPPLSFHQHEITLPTDMSAIEKDSSDGHLNDTNTSPVSNRNKKTKYTEWTRLNHKGIYHDNRRLLKHRAKNCECSVCYREIHKLPPTETPQEYAATIRNKIHERSKKRAKKQTKKDIKMGKQGLMEQFFVPLG